MEKKDMITMEYRDKMGCNYNMCSNVSCCFDQTCNKNYFGGCEFKCLNKLCKRYEEGFFEWEEYIPYDESQY